MSEPFIGEIRIFGGNYAPVNWALCNGQILAIRQNTALFSLLGTNYGGDGKTTFGLPNLQGCTPMHWGQGPGLSNRSIGETGGTPIVTLISSQMPAHSHALMALGDPAESNKPSGKALARGVNLTAYGTAPNTNMAPAALSVVGGGQAHENMPPYLTLNFIIALQGIFPPRG